MSASPFSNQLPSWQQVWLRKLATNVAHTVQSYANPFDTLLKAEFKGEWARPPTFNAANAYPGEATWSVLSMREGKPQIASLAELLAVAQAALDYDGAAPSLLFDSGNRVPTASARARRAAQAFVYALMLAGGDAALGEDLVVNFAEQPVRLSLDSEVLGYSLKDIIEAVQEQEEHALFPAWPTAFDSVWAVLKHYPQEQVALNQLAALQVAQSKGWQAETFLRKALIATAGFNSWTRSRAALWTLQRDDIARVSQAQALSKRDAVRTAVALLNSAGAQQPSFDLYRLPLYVEDDFTEEQADLALSHIYRRTPVYL